MRRRIENLTEKFNAFRIARKIRKEQRKIQELKEEDRKSAKQLAEKLTLDVKARLQALGCYTTVKVIELESGDVDTAVSLHFQFTKEADVMRVLEESKIIDRFVQNDLTVEILKVMNINDVEEAYLLFGGIIDDELLNQLQIPKVEQRPNI